MRIHKYIVCLFFLFTLSACLPSGKVSNAGPKDPLIGVQPSGQVFSKKVASPEFQNVASQKIKSIIRKFNDADCTRNSYHEECKKIEYSWVPARPLKSSVGQRILILEDRLPPHSLLGRYRNRVIGIYDVDKNGSQKYFPIFPKAMIYSAYNEIGNYLSELPHVPVQSLGLYQFPGTTQITQVEALNYEDHEPGPAARHQEAVFELMADLNPNAQFVFARYPSLGQLQDMVCDYLDENKRNKTVRYYYGAGISLLDLIKEFEVTHVNSSFGLQSLKSLKDIAKKDCGIYPNQISDEVWKGLLDLERAPFEALEKAPNTIVFKSLDNFPEEKVGASTEEYLNECTPYTNFVRVAYLEVPTSHLPKMGSKYDRRLVGRNQQLNKGCADVYVNGGFKRSQWGDPAEIGPKPLTIYNNGLQIAQANDEPAFMMSTSWAAPLALSYSITIGEEFKRAMGRDLTPEGLKTFLNPDIGKNPWMIDPLFYDHFELFQH